MTTSVLGRCFAVQKYVSFLKVNTLERLLLESVLLISAIIIVKGIFLFLAILILLVCFGLKIYLHEKEWRETNINFEGLEFLRLLVLGLKMGMNLERSYFIASLALKTSFKPKTLLILKADSKSLSSVLPPLTRPLLDNILSLESLAKIRLNQFTYSLKFLTRKTEEITNDIKMKQESRQNILFLGVAVALIMILTVHLIPKSLQEVLSSAGFNGILVLLLASIEAISII